MDIKPTIPLTASELAGVGQVLLAPRLNGLPVPMPQDRINLPTPATLGKPRTIWGTLRAAKYHRALTDLTKAENGHLRARVEMAKSLVAAARVASEIAELTEICDTDLKIRRLNRERDFLAARTELEQARYGLYATQDEVDKLREPRVKKAPHKNAAAIDALMRTKIDMEALGEDTGGLEDTLAVLKTC